MNENNIENVVLNSGHIKKGKKIRSISSRIVEKHTSLETEKVKRMIMEILANSIKYSEDKKCRLSAYFINEDSILITENLISEDMKKDYLSKEYKKVDDKILISLGGPPEDIWDTNGRGIFIVKKDRFGIVHLLRPDTNNLTTAVFYPDSLDLFSIGIPI